jgi:hypothetical protein
MIVKERLAPRRVAYFSGGEATNAVLASLSGDAFDVFNRAAEAVTTSERESRCA